MPKRKIEYVAPRRPLVPRASDVVIQGEIARRELSRRKLLYFTRQTVKDYAAGWVHDDICRRLERFSDQVAKKQSPRLMLLVPPRHGKSELASIRFPAWHLGHYPRHEIVNVGYNLDLPMKFSRTVRDLVRDPFYKAIFYETKINPESTSVESWLTTAGGGFTAVGVGGGLTGKGAHILTIDDPIKNIEEADNILVRDQLYEWFQTVAYTRLSPGGGVLLIECMTGDTPVRMADGSERRLDALRAGAEIATYENGRLATSTVVAQKSSGRDHVLRITTSSGRVVRANGRHPFLVADDSGGLRWIRARSLTTGHRIVALPDSGASGRVNHASQRDAVSLSCAGGTVPRTTVKRSGQTGTDRRPITPRASAPVTSSTGTVSLLKSLTASLLSRAARVLSAAKSRLGAHLHIGATGCASTTTTPPAGSGGCCVTAVTPHSDILELSAWHLPRPGTSDFTTDRVISIEPGGVEEVFDLQVARTENFIANGLASHNTWWNDDDLAGRLQNLMRSGDAHADQYEVVRYPALAEQYEFRDKVSLSVRRDDKPDMTDQEELLRSPGEALHPDRYDAEALKRYKANMALRHWSALYQQNPVPDEGAFFKKEYFKYTPKFPLKDEDPRRVYTAWDFAIGEKQTNDWNVGATIVQDHDDNLYPVEIVRFRGDAYTIIEEMLNAAARWGHDPRHGYLLGAEDGQLWKALKPLFHRRCHERRVYPSLVELKPLSDKLARARPLQGRLEHGKVWFPESAAWLPTLQQEFLRFPAGAHDDIVDAMAWAVQLVVRHSPPRKHVEPRKKSWKDRLMLLPSSGGHMSA